MLNRDACPMPCARYLTTDAEAELRNPVDKTANSATLRALLEQQTQKRPGNVPTSFQFANPAADQ
jgi:hypothetical protein